MRCLCIIAHAYALQSGARQMVSAPRVAGSAAIRYSSAKRPGPLELKGASPGVDVAEASSRSALAFLLAGLAGACLPYLSNPCFEGDARCQLDGGDDGGDGGGETCTVFNCHGCCSGNACLPPTLQSN